MFSIFNFYLFSRETFLYPSLMYPPVIFSVLNFITIFFEAEAIVYGFVRY